MNICAWFKTELYFQCQRKKKYDMCQRELATRQCIIIILPFLPTQPFAGDAIFMASVNARMPARVTINRTISQQSFELIFIKNK